MSETEHSTPANVENYSRMAMTLGGTQDRNANAHRELAVLHAAIAEQHKALAASVPDGDQAAADLGMVSTEHDIANMRHSLKLGNSLLHDGLDQMDATRAQMAAFALRMDTLESIVRRIAASLGVAL